MTNADVAGIETQFWPKGLRRDIWMIVDAARDRHIYGLLLDSYFEYSCLYSGTLAPELELAAPYLVQLEFEERYTRRLIERAWGRSWGIFLRCDTSLESLRRHLRTLLIVRGPDGRRLAFRYYDPRVLRDYLPTCLPDELRAVFGPIECFWTEDVSPEVLLRFSVFHNSLERSEVALGQPAALSAVGKG